MSILDEPPDDGKIFHKPGRDWTREERLRVKVWLNTPPHIGRLLRYTSLHLGQGTTEDDAEDAWGAFCVEDVDRTIDLYDARAPFEPFLLLRLRQHCWREGKRIRRRGEESIERETTQGESHELVIVDPDADTEQGILDRIRLERCLSALSPADLSLVVRHHFEGEQIGEIAEHLGISRENVKIRLFRVRRRLRACLEPA